MAEIEILIEAGEDDLRDNCWADLTVKLKGHDQVKFEKVVQGLSGRRHARALRDLPELTNPEQVEFFQLIHVSQEAFLQTRDNWDLGRVSVMMKMGRFPIELAAAGPHRFTGAAAVLQFAPPAA